METILEGSIKAISFPPIISFVSLMGKSGILKLTRNAEEACVYFDHGKVMSASSNQDKFCSVQPGSPRHQKIQVSEIIYDCYLWSEGRFLFQETSQFPDDLVQIAIDLTTLILEGARRIQDDHFFKKVFSDSQAVFRLVNPPESLDLALTLDEWKVLFLINGRRSLEQICGESEQESPSVFRLLYGLYANQLLKAVPEETIDWSSVNTVPDDSDLLVSPGAKLSYSEVLKVTLARLTLQRSHEETQIFPLIEQEYYIGRQPGTHIHLTDSGISSVHARIFRGPEGYVLEDLKSRNGTFINGTRIDRKVLRERDSIQIGSTNLVYNIVYEVKQK